MEELASQDGSALERLYEKIGECEAVVYLIGECYGPEAPQGSSNPLRSFAQLEFDIAWELDKPICIFVFTDDFPFDAHEPEPPDCRALQKEHRVALCSDDECCVNIGDKTELADRLKQLLPRPERSQPDAPRKRVVVQSALGAAGPTPRKPSPKVPPSPLAEAPRSVCPQPPAPIAVVAFHENVQFTAYRPKVIAPAKWTKMLIFAHLDDRPNWLDDDELGPIEEMELEAARILGSKIEDYRPTTSDSSVAIPEDGEITMVPEIKGIEFNPPRRAFLWKDSVTVHHETFDMRANAALNGQTARGQLTIFLGHLILAEITLAIRIDSNQGAIADSSFAGRQRSSARPFRRVFASYSRRDLQIVEATERYGRTLGDEYIRDLVYLRSGEVWNDQLRELVRWADVFQLFWSLNAARSEYVESEWRYALSLNRPAFVRPTYWQEPMPDPPEPLRGIHFHRLITETNPQVPPPSMPHKPSKEPEATASVAESPSQASGGFMPRSQTTDTSGPLFMPSPSVNDSGRHFMPSAPYSDVHARKAGNASQTGLTPRAARLIFLCLVIAAVLLVIVAALRTR